MTPEGIIKRSICDYLYYLDNVFYTLTPSVGIYDSKLGMYRKNQSKHQLKGMADITGFILVNSLPIAFFLEVKTERNKQSEDQIEFERVVKVNGGFYFIVRSIDDTKLALEKIINECSKH
jgi:hypothetical protein